jgi:hypothetical protein
MTCCSDPKFRFEAKTNVTSMHLPGFAWTGYKGSSTSRAAYERIERSRGQAPKKTK